MTKKKWYYNYYKWYHKFIVIIKYQSFLVILTCRIVPFLNRLGSKKILQV